MSFVTQTIAVLTTNLRSIRHRVGNSLVIVISIAGVVAVLISVLAMAIGFRTTIAGDGRPDRAIVLTRAATSEYESSLSRENFGVIATAPGLRHDSNDKPVVSGEVVLVAPLARKRNNADVSVTLRGVGENYFALRGELKLIAGRMFRAGTQELLVGEAARKQFAGLEIGNQVRMQDGDWTVVGTFAGADGARESELIADAQTVMSIYKLNAFNSVFVALKSEGAFEEFRSTLTTDATLSVDVRTEPDYLASASSSINRMLQLVAYAIGSIMALGALFAALNSMQAVVAARGVEIATFRAIGFSSGAVALAVLIEALLLALCGATIGVAIAYFAFDGTVISTLGGAVWDSQLVYSLAITPSLVATATLLACALGLVGAIFPAIRAAHSNVADALHAT